MWTIVTGIVLIILLPIFYYQALKAGRLERPRTEEAHTLKTADLWKLRLYRFRKPDSNGQAVLLVHGLNANHHNFICPPGASMIDHLVEAGYDCWAIDLRGCRSAVPPFERSFRDCTIDQYVQYDLPAAVHYVREATGHDQIHWVGHSLGGMLLYAYAQIHGEAHIASGITLGAPLGFQGANAKAPRLLLVAVRCCPRLLMAMVRCLIPLGKLFRVSFPYFPANLRNIPRAMKVRHFFHMLETPLPEVNRAMAHWLRTRSWTMLEGQKDIQAGLKGMRFPLLAFYAPKDPFVPLEQARAFIDALPHSDKKQVICAKKAGCQYDYNHVDLVFGKNGKAEVYEPIVQWIAAHRSDAAYAAPAPLVGHSPIDYTTPLVTATTAPEADAPAETTESPVDSPQTPPSAAAETPQGADTDADTDTGADTVEVANDRAQPEAQSKADTPHKDSEHTPSPTPAERTDIPAPDAAYMPAETSDHENAQTTDTPAVGLSGSEPMSSAAPAPETPLTTKPTSEPTPQPTPPMDTPVDAAAEPLEVADAVTAPEEFTETKKEEPDSAPQKGRKALLPSSPDTKEVEEKPALKTRAKTSAKAKPKTSAKRASRSKKTSPAKPTPTGNKSKGKQAKDKSSSADKSTVLPKATRRAIAQAGDLMRAVSEPKQPSPGASEAAEKSNQEGKAKNDE